MTKGTLQGTKYKKVHKSGFRKRMRTISGQRIIRSRRKKGRKSLIL